MSEENKQVVASEEKKEVKESASTPSDAKATAGKEETKEVKVPAKFKSLVGEIEKMSVLDLAELVKILEEKFGVSAAAPAMMFAGAGAAGAAAEPVEEKSSFDIEITEAGSNKIAVIKAIREFTEMGLKDAKDLVDAAPKVVKEAVKKEEAEEIKKKLEAAGAKVTLK
ncbi:50S ribosomal protein L7/L12 [Patescibacteria group bacterium]|nr:50S ribosomal protein L7/L12 [Candidatus Falkowbacteria bacterium]MBU3905490.1 50S ribosomal protein L7/L12 [Patescibacteria group bacterium]MBU4014839.1 50S ribosomal protein L7/L12 [Patescibacteria group bacterium]MBU4026597.1 50S ribosomal protein L7/L12 [Patescibacteria group bacterium]MBU4073496.1 50S ribosomal protein L7/L12 [Patescibacteria group bacterium]